MCNVAVRLLHGRFSRQAMIGCLFAIFSVGLIAACGSVGPVVKVGLVAPFEGRHRAIGYDALYSARLAVREINAAGGINGTRVALVALDDSGQPELAEATAASLVVDPSIVAVVGHWLPETTAAAQGKYVEGGLAFLPGGAEPYLPADPRRLSPAFVESYTSVTPFDEMPGPYAAPAYAAYQELWRLLAEAQQRHGSISRTTVEQTVSQTQP
jgi:hypothetical protein